MTAAQGWDRADFHCGRCGAAITATTEADVLRDVSAHQDAHEVWDRLDPIERDGMRSILRTLMSDPALLVALHHVAMTDQHKPGHTG